MNLRDNPTYQSKYLRPEDLQGRTVAVTIQSVLMEKFYNRKVNTTEEKAVIRFYNKQRGLVVNMTRLQQLEKIFGTDNTQAYIDMTILIHPTVQQGKNTIWISGVPD